MPVLEEEVVCCSHMEYLHFHKEVRDFVNCRFPEKWVVGARLVTCPLCLSDLTAHDFSFRGYIKDALYVPPAIGHHFARTSIMHLLNEAFADIVLDRCFNSVAALSVILGEK